MVMLQTTKDALQQVEALLARRVVLEGFDISKYPVKGGPNPYAASAAALTAPDVNNALKLQQQWLQKFVTQGECWDVFEELMAVAERYRPIERRVTAENSKEKPSTKDAAVTIDEKYDDSVLFYLLDTMTKILQALLKVNNQNIEQDILPIEAKAPPGTLQATAPTVDFAFGYLHHSYASPTRYGAANLLGVLTNLFLGQATEKLTEKQNAAKKDDAQRDYSSYQQAVGYLQFGVGDMKRALATNTYLYELAKKMKDIDRGVLRQEICSSLNDVFTRVLQPNDARKQLEFSKFAQTGGQAFDAWNNNYRDIYERAAKWSSKDKHALFSWELMLRMLTLTPNKDFFLDKKRYDVFGAVVKGLSKKDMRQECLTLVRNYVRDVPEEYLQADIATWSAQARALMTALFGKKAPKPEDDEIPLMTDIFVEVGKKYTAWVITDVVADVLKPESQYYTRQKSIALKGLAAIAKSKKTNTTENLGLAPLLTPYIEEGRTSTDEKKIGLMKSALQCWPTVRGATPQAIQQTAATIVPLTLHDDREVSTLALNSLQEFVQLDMNAYYLPTLHALIDQLQEVDPTQSIVVLKLCNNIIVLLQALADFNKAPPAAAKAFAPQQDAWVALREHLEAVGLARLTHPEGWVRTEILRVLLKLNGPELVVFEEKVALRSARVVEALLPGVTDVEGIPASTEVFWSPLRKLITTPSTYQTFSGIIAAAWSYLHTSTGALQRIDAGERKGDEWLSVFKNEFLFLCLTVRPGEGGAGSATSRSLERQSSQRVSQGGELGGPSQAELLLKYQTKRDRLHISRLQANEVSNFYDQTVTFLQSNGANTPQTVALREALAADLSQVEVSNHTELLRHLRAPLTAQPADPKAKKQPPGPREGFTYHRYTLDLLARLVIRVSPERYHSGVTVLTKTLDELVTQWTADTPDSYSSLPPQTRYYMASLFTRFIFYRTSPKQHANHVSKTDVLNRRQFFFTRIVSLLQGDKGDRPTQVRLESAVLSGVASIIALGQIKELPLSNNVLSFLEQQLPLIPPPHIHDGVTLSLQLFLRLNHHRISDFIRFSLPEVHDPTSPHYLAHGVYNAVLKKKDQPVQQRPTVAIIARYYAKALSAGISHDYAVWTEQYRVTSAEMLLVSLLLMNSADGEVRQAALILVDDILRADKVALGDEARLFSPTSPFMYTPGTIDLARAIASKPAYLTQLPSVMRRAVDLFAFIAEGKKEILLRLLIPFAAQFAPLIRGLNGLEKGSQDVSNAVSDVLSSLFQITRLCSTSGILSQSVKELWIAVLSIEPITPQLVSLVLAHLITHYTGLLQEGSGSTGAMPTVDVTHPPAAHSAVGSAAGTPVHSGRAIDAPVASTAGRPSLSRTASLSSSNKDDEPPSPTKTSTSADPKTPASSAKSAAATGTPGSDAKKLSDVHEDALAIPDAEALDMPVRDVLLEKALLRMIATHLSRGGHAMLIITGLVEKLRNYPDSCPTDPQEFLAWFTDRHQPSNEPTTLEERAAFELVVNTIFERGQEDLSPFLPTLLLNAYVLFPGSALSDELLKNVCLSLHMLDIKQAADVVIGEQFFINNLAATHPPLRAQFSQSAFIWSINSRDTNIAGAAFRIFQELESQSFYFGSGQSTLIRVIELIYVCLKNKEARRLKSIVQVLLLPTDQPYDQQGWSALLSASIALLSSHEIAIYQLGLQLFQHLIAYPVPEARKKQWLVKLGPELFGSTKDSPVSIENGAVELLFKGLSHPVTSDDTLAVLQTLNDYYAGTGLMPVKNRVAVTVLLMNVLLRSVELNRYAEEKGKTGVQLTEAQLVTRQRHQIKSASALTALATSLFDAADNHSADAEQFNALANIFKNTALSLALTLPDTPAPVEAAEGEKQAAATLDSTRTELYSRLLTFVKQTGPVEVVGALNGVSVPATTQMLIPFFRSFTVLYDSQEQHDWVVGFFARTLQRHVAEWRTVLLTMLGRYLLEAAYNVDIAYYVQLSEAVAQSFYSTDKDEQHLADNLAFLLVQKKGSGQAKPAEIFNLIKSRASLRRAAASATSLNSAEEKVNSDTVLTAALQRFQQSAFPSLNEMNAKARDVTRGETVLSPRHAKVAASPSVLLANNNAADVASAIAAQADVKQLDLVLSSGVHGGTHTTLAAATTATTATAKLAADEAEAKEEEAVRSVSFASLLKVAESSQRVVPEKKEVNPFAAGGDEEEEEGAAAGAVKANPFGSDDEAKDADEDKEKYAEPEVAERDDSAKKQEDDEQAANGHSKEDGDGEAAEGEDTNPFA